MEWTIIVMMIQLPSDALRCGEWLASVEKKQILTQLSPHQEQSGR
jgi:hypothetical protein